jgi:hypothetical protein
MLHRRSLLAAPAVLMLPGHPVLTLQPGDSVHVEATLALPSGAVFTCPARRARLVAVLRMGALDSPDPVALVQFAADTGGAVQDAMAFIDAGGRLLALERGSWHAPAGMLDTRVAMLPDRRHIALSRVLAWHDTQWHRETWTDYLRADHARLVDAPQRAILASTGQHRLIALRSAMQAILSPPPKGLPPEAIATLRDAASPLPASPFPQ